MSGAEICRLLAVVGWLFLAVLVIVVLSPRWMTELLNRGVDYVFTAVDELFGWTSPTPPVLKQPADFDSWSPLGQELWAIINAPRFDVAAFDAVMARERPRHLAAASGAADEAEFYGEPLRAVESPQEALGDQIGLKSPQDRAETGARGVPASGQGMP